MREKQNSFESLADALEYIKGYCNKHASCAGRDSNGAPCRLYDEIAKQCFLYTSPVPSDWEVEE